MTYLLFGLIKNNISLPSVNHNRMVEMVENYSLKDLKIGEQAVITGFTTDDIPAKFYEMGFIPGTNLLVKNKAPFGGPICISIISNKSVLALRRNEADKILITKK